MNDLVLTNNILQIVAIGLGLFVFAVISMTVLFGMATKDILKNKKGIVGMLLMAILLPAGVIGVKQKINERETHANMETKLNNLEMVPGDTDNWVISFQTDKPVIGYLEVITGDGKTIPVLPTYKIETRDDHYFLVEKEIFESGKIFAVIEGNKILIKK